jgi:hypothetical protein
MWGTLLPVLDLDGFLGGTWDLIRINFHRSIPTNTCT